MVIELLLLTLLKLKTNNMKTTVHIVYFSDEEQIYSKGINIEGKSFSDCCKKFEAMKIGLIFNATIKE